VFLVVVLPLVLMVVLPVWGAESVVRSWRVRVRMFSGR